MQLRRTFLCGRFDGSEFLVDWLDILASANDIFEIFEQTFFAIGNALKTL